MQDLYISSIFKIFNVLNNGSVCWLYLEFVMTRIAFFCNKDRRECFAPHAKIP